jgi:large conductance mechanosensitive channel
MTVQSDLQKYLLQGNIINLSVAIIFGSTFSNFISSIVTNIIYPILSFFFDNVDFSKMNLKLGKIDINYGNVINTGLTFVISILTVFFIFIRPVSQMIKDQEKKDKVSNT